LSLARTTKHIAWIAVGTNLSCMARKGSPPLYLDHIDVRQSSAKVIPAIPLEPSAWVRPKNPPLTPPMRQRLPAFYAEIVVIWVRRFADLCILKPRCWKLVSAIVAVFSLKHTHLKHLFRREKWCKIWCKILPDRCHQLVAVIRLHLIINSNCPINFHAMTFPLLVQRFQDLTLMNVGLVYKPDHNPAPTNQETTALMPPSGSARPGGRRLLRVPLAPAKCNCRWGVAPAGRDSPAGSACGRYSWR
jgi:hypothetical protein